MRILIIDKSVFSGCLTNSENALFKHLEFWSESNRIDLFARPDEAAAKRLKQSVNLLKLPPNIPFILCFYIYFRIFIKPKRYDLIAEIWRKKPLFRLFFNLRRSFAVIFSDDFKFILPGVVFSLIYRKMKFLLNSYSLKEKFLSVGFDNAGVCFLPDADINQNNSKNPTSKIRKKNKILLVAGKDAGSAFSLIGLIERRSLDWKFIVLSEKKNIKKFKNMFKASGLESPVKIIPFEKQIFTSNLAYAKFLLLTKDTKKISDYAIEACAKRTPVVFNGKLKKTTDKGVKNLIISCENKLDLADKIDKFSKNTDEYEKLLINISKTAKPHTWEETGELSRKFIESL